MDINLEYYKIFYYVAKLGGITLAAEKLCISQPAVSQSVKLLEKSLGARLFVRTAKGVRLTPEGEILFSYVQRGYESILEGEEKFREMKELESGEIRIGASDMTLQFYLLPHLQRFHENYPKIKVRVTNAPTPETIEYLADGNIDFGVISSPISVKDDYIITNVRQIEDAFVAGSKFEYLKNRTVEYKELEILPIICLEDKTSTRKYVDNYLAKKNCVLTPEVELATSDMIVKFAMRNFGIGCVVRDFAQPYIDTGELFELSFNERIPKRNICIITKKNNPVSGAAKILLNMMYNQ